MSEAAVKERVRRQGWAAPEGAHDKLVQTLKIGLPATIGLLTAYLAMAPLAKGPEISFILDKNKVELTQERLRVDRANYRGQDDKGRAFLLSAQSAFQASADEPLVRIGDVRAEIVLDTGPAMLMAPQARYDFEEQTVLMGGPVRFRDAQGYRLDAGVALLNLQTQVLVTNRPATLIAPDGRRVEARSATVNLNTRRITSEQPVLFTAPDGYRLQTGAAAVDLDGRTMASDRPIAGRIPLGRFEAGRMDADLDNRQVVLGGRARLHIEQGGLR
jgi:lipopolysaccharide export system protein LptC